MYLDVRGWGTAAGIGLNAYPFHGDTNQQFIAKFDEITSDFRFEPVYTTGKSLSYSSNYATIENTSTSSLTQKFRPAYVGNGRYRIMTGSSDFADVLKVKNNLTSPGGDIDDGNYLPNKLEHYWTFEEIIEVNTTGYYGALKANKIYRTNPTANAYYAIESTSSVDNCFRLAKRYGTGNTGVSYSAYINSTTGMIYYLDIGYTFYWKVMPGNYQEITSLSSLNNGYYRYTPTITIQSSTISVPGKNIKVMNNADGILTKKANTVTIPTIAWETYYIVIS